MEIPDNIPDAGAVFAFGNSKFADNRASCFWLKNDVITSISCGDEHTALITEAGKLYVFGSNDWGQLGLGHTHPVNKPTCIKSLKVHKATMVACGRNHTLVYTSTNKLFAFGNNSDSQLGVDDLDNSNVPIQINTENIGPIKQIGAGADFSVLLTTEGDVYAWGSNVEGQLGLGGEINEALQPTLIKSLESSVYFACGYYHIGVVTKQGALCTFGEDEYGKLGDRESNDTSVPSKIVLNDSVRVVKVACGGSHTAFISHDGNLYTMGDGSHGELGHGENISQLSKPKLVERLKGHHVTHVSCGENFTAVITERGRIYTFGDGRHGKLALDEENFTNQFKPFRCSRFNDFNVKFAECGGCHMIVSATQGQNSPDEIESEDEDPMQTFVGKKVDPSISITPELNGGVNDTTLDTGEKIVNLSRSLSAREKRRKDRGSNLSKTLPPLRTLKPYELMEAAKTLPKPVTIQQNNSFSNEWSHVSKNKQPKAQEPDLVSEISAFNKVHVLQQVGEINTLTPVRSKPKNKNDSETASANSKSPKMNGKEQENKTIEVTPISHMQENKDVSIVQEITSSSKNATPPLSEDDDDDDEEEEEDDADDEEEFTDEDETEEEESDEEEESQELGDKKAVVQVPNNENSTVSNQKESEKTEEKQENVETQKQKKGIFNIFKREKKEKSITEPKNKTLDEKESTSSKTVDSQDSAAKDKSELATPDSVKSSTPDPKPKDEAPMPAAAPPSKVDESKSKTVETIKEGDDTTTSDFTAPTQTTEPKTTEGVNTTVAKKQKSKFCVIL